MTRDIAVLAFHLAHGADGQLDKQEVEEIARRLDKWRRDPDSPTTLASLKEALDRYEGRADGGDVQTAMTRLRDALSEAERVELLNDLVAIAHADDTLAPGEVSFLRTLREAWELG